MNNPCATCKRKAKGPVPGIAKCVGMEWGVEEQYACGPYAKYLGYQDGLAELMWQRHKLPTWDECNQLGATSSPIAMFVLDNEPAGKNEAYEFREGLQKALDAACQEGLAEAESISFWHPVDGKWRLITKIGGDYYTDGKREIPASDSPSATPVESLLKAREREIVEWLKVNMRVASICRDCGEKYYHSPISSLEAWLKE